MVKIHFLTVSLSDNRSSVNLLIIETREREMARVSDFNKYYFWISLDKYESLKRICILNTIFIFMMRVTFKKKIYRISLYGKNVKAFLNWVQVKLSTWLRLSAMERWQLLWWNIFWGQTEWSRKTLLDKWRCNFYF